MNTLLSPTPVDELRGDIWAYVSPTRLNTWLACPLKFKLRYLDGIWPPTSPGLFLGQQVHACLATYYRHRQGGTCLAAADVTGSMRRDWDTAVAAQGVRFESAVQERATLEQTVRLVEVYLQQVRPDELPPLAVEARFETPLIDPLTGENLGLPLVGVVDLVLPAREGPVIIDFKTASRAAAPLEITHEVQLTAYAYLWQAVSGQAASTLEIRSLIKTLQPQITLQRYPPRTASHLRRLFAVIREYLAALDAGRYNYRPGWSCGLCDFRQSHCADWTG